MDNLFFVIAVIVWTAFCVGCAIYEGADYLRKKKAAQAEEEAARAKRVQETERAMPVLRDLLDNPAVQVALRDKGLKVDYVALSEGVKKIDWNLSDGCTVTPAETLDAVMAGVLEGSKRRKRKFAKTDIKHHSDGTYTVKHTPAKRRKKTTRRKK